MGNLIEIIFDNPFLLFIIIAGIVSFFNRMTSSSSNEEEKSEQEGQGETSGRQTVRDAMRKMQEMAESFNPDAETTKPQRRTEERQTRAQQEKALTKDSTPTYSFEEQRQEQYRQLQKQYESRAQIDDVETRVDIHSPIYDRTSDIAQDDISRSDVSVNLKSRLKKDGLVESIVMAEILGPPRARKRYSNRYSNR